MTWLEPRWLLLLGALPVLALLAAIGGFLSRRAAARFFGRASGRPWTTTGSGALGGVLVLLVLGALAFTTLALARPANNPIPKPSQRPGRDLVFIIDVSRSMLAQDLKPSRLERAKLAGRDVLDIVEGDRVAVLAFAGSAVVKCPLTTDYAFARMAIDDLSTNSVSRGGTAIGDGIRLAMTQLFPDAGTRDGPKRARTIVLMTDGEDQESRPVEAAKEAGEKGVRVVTIGLGSEVAGAPVPAPQDEFGRTPQASRAQVLEYHGKPVESKMNSSVLKQVAEATPGGVFLNVGTGNVELDQVYKRLMRTQSKLENASTTEVKYNELFQIAIGAALALLAVEGLVRGVLR